MTTPNPAQAWRLVPVEPTPEMRQTGELAWMNRDLARADSDPISDCYRAMLSAAKPPASGVDAVAWRTVSDFVDEMLRDWSGGDDCRMGFGLNGATVTKGQFRAVQAALASLSPAATSGSEAEPVADALAKGCCSAASPCFHQKHDPTTICEACRNAATRANSASAEAVRDDMARAIARVDGIELDWITDQTNPRWVKYRAKADAACAALAKPASSPAGRVWTVKGWLPNGDGCEFTFGDESEYLRFMASKPATFDVSDIEELVVSSCGRALASLSTEVIALSPSTSAAEPVASAWRWTCKGDSQPLMRLSGTPLMVSGDVIEVQPLYATPPAPAAVDGQRVKDGWQPWETAPRDDKDVLARNGDFYQVVFWDTDENTGWHVSDADLRYPEGAFSHWRRDCLATDKEGA